MLLALICSGGVDEQLQALLRAFTLLLPDQLNAFSAARWVWGVGPVLTQQAHAGPALRRSWPAKVQLTGSRHSFALLLVCCAPPPFNAIKRRQ